MSLENTIALLRSMGLHVEYNEKMARECNPDLAKRTREALANVKRDENIRNLRQCGK